MEASAPNQIWQSDMTEIWVGPAVGWTYRVSVIDCCTREIVGWNLSPRSRPKVAPCVLHVPSLWLAANLPRWFNWGQWSIQVCGIGGEVQTC